MVWLKKMKKNAIGSVMLIYFSMMSFGIFFKKNPFFGNPWREFLIIKVFWK